jgi:heat shock protein HspQ
MYKHATRYNHGTEVWHRVTRNRGVIFGIQLRENSMTQYYVVFDDNRTEALCYESELLDKPVTAITPS